MLMQSPIAIPCFKDNYIWMLVGTQGCWVVDPGDAAPVLTWLTQQKRTLAGILLTHHHADHVGGARALARHFDCPVWGPDECADWRTHALPPQGVLTLAGLGTAHVLSVSAHTLGHVAYHFPQQAWLFCGDALFSAGCGRLFEGTADDLQRALGQINQLPANTQVFPAHEYTLSNLRFAQQVEPDNLHVTKAIREVQEWRTAGQPSLPTTLMRERLINPFLRLQSPELKASVSARAELPFQSELETLRLLRLWKDQS